MIKALINVRHLLISFVHLSTEFSHFSSLDFSSRSRIEMSNFLKSIQPTLNEIVEDLSGLTVRKK